MTETEKLEAIQELGRQTAGSLMTSAIETSQDADQAENQMLVTYWAGVHLAATYIFNQCKLEGKNNKDVLRAVITDIQDECDSLFQADKDGEMELKKFPGGEHH